MATPNRYTIVEQLKTDLTAITVANGYNTTIAAVERVARIPEELLNVTRRPFIGIMPGDEVFSYHPSERARVEFTIYLTLIVDGATAITIGERLSNCKDDVFKALKAVPRLTSSGTPSAVSIAPIRCGTSEGDANMLEVKAGYMEIELRCLYWRNYGAT